MKIYDSCPTQKTARGVWGYFCKKHGRAPRRLWKVPQCFKKETTAHDAYGKWVADFIDYRDYYDPTRPEQQPVKNVYSFLKEQIILEEALK